MGLFDRLSRVVRANLNEMVEQSENPEMLLEQAIIDMQEDLVQLRQAVAGAISTQKRTEQQYNKNQSEANNWQQRAQLALTKGDENLASEALTRKKANSDTAAQLKTQLDQQVTQVDTLQRNLIALESKISEAKTKKDLLKSRAAAAKANEQLQQGTINGLNTGGSMAVFERMEEKVLMMEARSESAKALADFDLEREFERLGPGSDFDDELEKMKEHLQNLPTPRKPKQVLVPEEILIIEKAIRDTRNAIISATTKQSQIDNQHIQAKKEVNNFHKQALQAALKGDQASAMQALFGEAAQEKLADVLKPQIEQQEAIIDLLKQNIAALEEVKITVEKLIGVEHEEEDNESETCSSSNSAVAAELELLRKQIDSL